jgi:hypothetical protein
MGNTTVLSATVLGYCLLDNQEDVRDTELACLAGLLRTRTIGLDPALSDHGRVLGPTDPSLGRGFKPSLGRGKGR